MSDSSDEVPERLSDGDGAQPDNSECPIHGITPHLTIITQGGRGRTLGCTECLAESARACPAPFRTTSKTPADPAGGESPDG